MIKSPLNYMGNKFQRFLSIGVQRRFKNKALTRTQIPMEVSFFSFFKKKLSKLSIDLVISRSGDFSAQWQMIWCFPT